MKRKKIVVIVSLMLMILMTCFPNQMVYAAQWNVPDPYDKSYLTIKSFDITEGAIMPGKAFDLNVTFYNTSSANNIGSATITYAARNDMVYAADGYSNQIYVDNMYVQREITVTFHMQASSDLDTDVALVDFRVVYADQESYANSNTIQLALPVSQSGTLEVQEYTVPSSVSVGTKCRIGVSYANSGINALSNISLNVTNDNLEEPLEFEQGTLAGGNRNYAEVYIDFTEVGTEVVEVSFTYEDSEGEVYETEVETFVIDIVEEEETQEAGETLISTTSSVSSMSIVMQLMLAVGIVVLIGLILVLYRKSVK